MIASSTLVCAHHSRVWNRHLGFTFKIPRRPPGLSKYFNSGAECNLYNTLVLRYLFAVASPDPKWEERLVALIGEHPTADPGTIGFPKKRQAMDIWNDSNWKLPQ